MPPGKATGTWNARPSRKASPPGPVGTVVSQVFVAVSKVVVATLAVGEKVTSAFGTLSA